MLGILLLGLSACEALRLERVDPPQLGLGLETGEPAEPAEPVLGSEPAELGLGSGTGEPAEGPPVAEVELAPEPLPAQAPEGGPAEAALAGPAGGGPEIGAEPLPAAQPLPQASSRPELLRAGELLGGALVDPEGTVLARVSDLLVRPGDELVLGVFATREALGTGEGAFVPREGVESWQQSQIRLTASAADALLAELRELETAELFRQRELETIEGELATWIDEGPGEGEDTQDTDEGAELVSITLVDDNNHLHRVVLGPLVMLKNAPLEKGSRVRILGLSMRDDAGPFEVAARLSLLGEIEFELLLRDDQGRTAWDPPVAPPRGWRFRELVDREARVGSEPVGTLAELEFRVADGGVAWVLLESGDKLLRLPWSCFERAGATWLDLPLSGWQAWTGKRARGVAANDDAPR